MGSAAGGDVIVHDVTFDDEATFLKEYEANIKHGGMFLAWQNPPPKDTKIIVRVSPPCGLTPLELEAVVVFPTPAGVGIEIRNLSREVKATFERYVEACKAAVASRAVATAGATGHADVPPAAGASEPTGDVAPSTQDGEVKAQEMVDTLSTPPTPGSQAQPVPPAAGSIPAAPAPQPTGTAMAAQPVAPSPPQPPVAPAPGPAQAVAPGQWATPQPGVTGVPPPSGQWVSPPQGQPPGPPPGWTAPPQGAHGAMPPPGYGGQAAQPTPPPRPNPSTPSWHGSLQNTPAPNVFVQLGSRQATGLLVMKTEVAESKFYFRNGSIVRFSREPPDPDRRFGQILLKDAKVSKTELDAALRDAKEKKLPIGQALVRRRALLSSGVGKILRQQMKMSILEQVDAKEGTFAFYDRVRPPRGQPMPSANPRKVIFRGRVDEYKGRLQPEMDKVEKPNRFRYLYPSPDAPDDMSVVGLNDNEIRFWTLCVTGGYMLKDVFEVSTLNRRTTHGLVFALLELGLVEFKDEMAPELRAKLMKKTLRRKQAEIGNANHFEVLEIHWISTEEEVKAAYSKVRKEYDAAPVAHLLSQNLIDLSKEILERIDLAYKELSTHNGRQLCRQASLEQAQIVFHVDLLMQQGDMAIFKGERREAIDRFTHVLEINPGNKEAKQKLQAMQTAPPTV